MCKCRAARLCMLLFLWLHLYNIYISFVSFHCLLVCFLLLAFALLWLWRGVILVLQLRSSSVLRIHS